MSNKVQRITPFLWFDQQAEEAARYYTSIFKNAVVLKTTRYGEEGAKASGMPKDAAMTVEFELDGQKFVALNGGPHFKFSEAISFVVNCESQQELDYFWEKLSSDGDARAQQCGWLKDKYGLSWQIVPAELGQLLSDSDPKKAGSVMQALLQMQKIDIDTLKRAHKQAA